jgi:ferredoxin
MESPTTYRVFIPPDRCWGSVIGDDSDQGACALCVEVCPEVFEKPAPNACARVRPGVDPAAHLAEIQRAMALCPVDAIRIEVRTLCRR